MALGDSRRESGRQMERARRQIGNDNEQARRQIGADMESQRRAIHAQMVATRRGVSVVEDMQRLESPTRTQRPLPTVAPVGGIPPARGRAYYSDKPKLGGGETAWPFTEEDAAEREFYESWRTAASSDGLIAISLRPIKSVMLTDANGAKGQIIYALPEDLTAPPVEE